MPITKRYFTRTEVAALLGVHPMTVRDWEHRYAGLRLRRTRAGRVRYTAAQIDKLQQLIARPPAERPRRDPAPPKSPPPRPSPRPKLCRERLRLL